MNAFKRIAAGSAGVALAITGLAIAPANAGTTGDASYTCTTPLQPGTSIAMKVNTTTPDIAYAGIPVPIASTVTLDDATRGTLAFFGAVAIKGTAKANFTSAGTPMTVDLTMPSTPVPASGTMSLTAKGAAPGVPAGSYALGTGDFTTTMTLEKANPAENGDLDASCTAPVPAPSLGTLTVNTSPSATKASAKKAFAVGKPAVVNANVKATSGLAATGAATVLVKKVGFKKTVKGTVKAGKVTFKVTKLKKGKYTAVVTYKGRAGYIKGSKSTAVRFTVK